MKYVFLFLACFAILPAKSQSAQVNRHRFNFGVAAGAGYLIQQIPGETAPRKKIEPSFPNIQLGWMVSPKLSVTVLLPGTLYKNTWNGRPRDRGFEGIVPSVQYWVTDKWWIGGGVGVGLDAPAFYDIKNEDERVFHFGYSGVLTSGYEFWQSGRFTMDARFRMHYNNVPVPGGRQSGLSANALLGVSWW
ncbi:MAG: hypothetical protein MUC87_19680 [Bacteroidia bacterium]|jgi:hypothetical protein|nr:hypothetical protein [Bacteroidia bacterium]